MKWEKAEENYLLRLILMPLTICITVLQDFWHALKSGYDTLNRWGVAMLLYTILLDILSVVMFPPTVKEIEPVKTGQPRHPPTMSGIARDSFIRGQIGTHEFRVDKPTSPKPSKEQMPPKK